METNDTSLLDHKLFHKLFHRFSDTLQPAIIRILLITWASTQDTITSLHEMLSVFLFHICQCPGRLWEIVPRLWEIVPRDGRGLRFFQYQYLFIFLGIFAALISWFGNSSHHLHDSDVRPLWAKAQLEANGVHKI